MDDPTSAAPVALVTGAARGIGLAVAQRFLAQGWRVALFDVDDVAVAAAAASLGAPQRVLHCHVDVSDAAQVAAAVARIDAQWQRLDALVNNAGIAIFKPMLQTTLDEWNRVLAVNLSGPFICTQACAPLLLQAVAAGHGPSVVNIASISGLRASTLRVAYGTSKAGVIQLTRQQAVELGALGIRVNAVAPGPVDTAMAQAVHSAEIRAAYHDAIPLGRYGTEDEIANAVCFLCSPAASYINGQVLAVDGGFESTGIGLQHLPGRHRSPPR